jgi:hypothetical protein
MIVVKYYDLASFAQSNFVGSDHVRLLGENTFSFEDLYFNSDNDFNLKINPSMQLQIALRDFMFDDLRLESQWAEKF